MAKCSNNAGLNFDVNILNTKKELILPNNTSPPVPGLGGGGATGAKAQGPLLFEGPCRAHNDIHN